MQFVLVTYCEGENASLGLPQSEHDDWFKPLLSQSDAEVLEHSGKLVLLFEILKMAEDLGDKM